MAHIIIYTMMSMTITIEVLIVVLHGKRQMKDIMGDNNKWDSPEMIVVYFLPLAVIMVLCDVFIGLHPSDSAYLFVAGGLGIGSAARGYMATRSKQKPPEKEERSNEG